MRGSTIITCPYCGKIARLQNYRLKEGRKNFCCKKCADAYQREHPELSPRYDGGKIKLQCSNCGNDVYRKKNQVERNKTGRFFCSIKCRMEFSKGEFAPCYKNATIKMVCDNCGGEFEKKRSNIKDKNFCSHKCGSEYHRGENNQNWSGGFTLVNCVNCGNEIYKTQSQLKELNFCSRDCSNAFHIKENASNWKGGISYYPYCEKFNDEFKERVRAFFGFKCVLCGIDEYDNGKKLSVHHVHYDKSSCCGDAPRQFVALCNKCHAKTNGNREKWRELFETLIQEKYNGKSYFTHEEMIKLGE